MLNTSCHSGPTRHLCGAIGGEVERTKMLLWRASMQTIERNLGTREDLANAPNDALTLRI